MRGSQRPGGFITYSLVRTITSLQYCPLISRASGEFGIPTQNDIVSGTSTCVDTHYQKIPTDLEPFMVVKVTPLGNRERMGDTDLRIPFREPDWIRARASSQRTSSLMVSFEREMREIAQDGSLIWTNVVFAHFFCWGC